MNAKIRKWDNSLAIRIPRAYAEEAALEVNSSVKLTVANGKLIIEPAKVRSANLRQLLEGVTKKNRHAELELGPPLGKECW